MTAPPHRYRETRALAHGGMATLSLAERDDGEGVVVKRVRPPFDHDPVYRGLFRDEGEVCARLSREPCCPHLVRLLDRGEDELGAYLVFEHVDGTDLGVVLEARFREGRGLDLAAFFAVALPLCEALASAHEATGDDGASLGVVHRDVSPGNVLLSKGGEVKLADFGVALSRLKTEHTVAGEMKGKFAYMAPEQTRADVVDLRADVFAAGVVFYEMLAGRRLFDGPTDADVVHAVREVAPPPLADVAPEVSAGLANVIARMLAKAPEERPRDMREVHAALLEEASALCLDRGHQGHVARLAHAHPREEPSEHPHVQELRRRTQRVLQASPAVVVAPRRSWLPLVLGAVSLGLVGVAAAISWPSEGTASDDKERAALVEPAALSSQGGPALAEGAPSTNAPVTNETVTNAPVTNETVTNETVTNETVTNEPVTEKRTKQASTIQKADRPRTKRERPAGARATAATSARVGKGFGTLVLESDPWANVTIDGEPLGQHTPLLGLRLPAGRHAITLENPVYGLERTIDVEIRPQAETRRFVDLTKR